MRYIDPPQEQGFDVEVHYWARRDGPDEGLEEELGLVVRPWVSEAWPFGRVAYPGRETEGRR